MKGITFGAYHSYNDFGLIRSKKEMESPPVKEVKQEIEGADSDLDLTDFFGEPKYEKAKHRFTFSTLAISEEEFLSLASTVKNALHGKKVRIILDDDPAFYYVGRVFVSKHHNEKQIGTIVIECDCEPYKLKLAKTVVSKAVNGTEVVTLTNLRKRAVPEVLIATGSSINIVYKESNVWDLGSGSYTLPELELIEGDNLVTVTGTGNITFTWQEAGL
jgi:phage-related protein